MPKKDQNRENFIVATYSGGATMQELADLFGVSHQRISQILTDAGASTWRRRKVGGIDPISLLRIIREPSSTSYAHVGRRCSNAADTVQYAVKQLGVQAAVDRLFRLRRRCALQARREERRQHLIRVYRDLCDKLGHVATIHELHPGNGTPFWTEFVGHRNAHTKAEWKPFANIAELRRAAGVDDTDQRAKRYKKD